MEIKNKLNIITNISIVITLVFTIILIIDEMYNIGVFSFKYTYNYNYGSFNSQFNNIQTIECETNRFKVYNNSNYLFKDIFNKSYFNYLIKIAITFITIMFVIAYGLYFYDVFIDNMPENCTFDDIKSLPKEILNCLCKDCHKFIPNCSGNYFIAFIIILLIPLSYLCKSFLWFDFTPNSNSTMFTLIYVLIFIILLFRYSYELFNKGNKETKIKDLIVYFLVTIIFIISGYLYKYIYNKYNNNITLNSVNNINTFNDIYRQTPPIKPLPVKKPDIVDTFKYDSKNTDPGYKLQKDIVDGYYRDIKNYETELSYYTQRYNNYVNSLNTNLTDKINFINVFLNISGLNNYLHLFIIALIIILAVIYYYYYKENQIIFVSMIYLLSLLTILTIFNAVQYYNTYINKYIIYEPAANYKSDIAVVNTKLNLILDITNGENFYNILTNNNKTINDNNNNNLIITKQTINNQIRNLNPSNIFENLQQIDSNIKGIAINTITTDTKNIIPENDYTVYFDTTTGINYANTLTELKYYFNIDTKTIKKYDRFKSFYITIEKFTRINNYKYPIDSLIFQYKNDVSITISSDYHTYTNLYIYYKSYQFYKLLDRLEQLLFKDINKLKKNYYNLFREINNNYSSIKNINRTIISDIDTNISNIAKSTISYDNIINKFKDFINEINTIKIDMTTFTNNKQLQSSLTDINFYSSDNIFTIPLTFNINVPEFANINIINNTYLELPIKIIDNKNNEYYITGTSFSLYYANIFIAYPTTTLSTIQVMSKYVVQSPKAFTKAADALYFTSSDITPIIYPFKLSSGISSDNYTNKFIQIIMRCLIYKLIATANNFALTNLCEKIFDTTPNHCTNERSSNKFNINQDLFTTLDINTISQTSEYKNVGTTDDAAFIKTANKYYGYLLMLYNIYTYDEETLMDIIEYSIYNRDSQESLNTEINSFEDQYLSINLDKIKTQINRNSKSEISSIYKHNIYIVKFIVKLYTMFINKLKYNIETKTEGGNSLCMPTTNFNKNTKEQMILDYITKKFNTVNLNEVSLPQSQPKLQQEITNISNNCTYFFNICLYILRSNINDGIDLSLQAITDSIISNYKFYNTEDVDTIDLTNLRKELTINCNYYNKYNDINTKQILTMKNNTTAVAYNFPVLVVILVIFLGESLFIKS